MEQNLRQSSKVQPARQPCVTAAASDHTPMPTRCSCLSSVGSHVRVRKRARERKREREREIEREISGRRRACEIETQSDLVRERYLVECLWVWAEQVGRERNLVTVWELVRERDI